MLFYYVDSEQGNYIWVINSLLTTFLLYQFLNASAFLISMSIGFVCGCAFYMYEHQSINFWISCPIGFLCIPIFFCLFHKLLPEIKKKN